MNASVHPKQTNRDKRSFLSKYRIRFTVTPSERRRATKGLIR